VSVTPQRIDRINQTRPPRRQPAGERGHDHEDRHDDRDWAGTERVESLILRLEDSHHDNRERNTNRKSCERQAQPFVEEFLNDPAPRCAERQTNADLTGSLSNGEGHDGEQANARKQERHRPGDCGADAKALCVTGIVDLVLPGGLRCAECEVAVDGVERVRNLPDTDDAGGA
jgi:hypothetical protein